MLFDLFINDILENIKGINIPTINKKIKGLLFADDAVVFADSPSELQIAFERVSEWAEKWEMQVNASKCGVIGIGQSTKMIFMMQNGIVPQVKEYKYLGVMFNDKWNHVSAIKNNAEAASRAISGMYYFLENNKTPIAIRATLIRSVIIPIATYGGEIFGMSQSRINKLQKIVDLASRLIIGAGKAVALTRLREELKIKNSQRKSFSLKRKSIF
ncbi:RNA-directed DNA polymerase from mobile element jockey [Smittium culicis]|uniref:RNA-directed DNA polymerase from mobile element jockey n=1 Tax=Smittium culicis TaxID=133412 RepID=A0A1R1XUN4_9FUNG|nr:RNA-directed DNA polymerase from mobile element jockey [Smittium culicis]